MTSPRLDQPMKGFLQVLFTCNPSDAQKLIDATMEEMQAMRDGAVTQESIDAALKKKRVGFEEAIRSNSWYCSTLLSFSDCRGFRQDTMKERIAAWWELYDTIARDINPEMVIETCQRAVVETNVTIDMQPQRGWCTG